MDKRANEKSGSRFRVYTGAGVRQGVIAFPMGAKIPHARTMDTTGIGQDILGECWHARLLVALYEVERQTLGSVGRPW